MRRMPLRERGADMAGNAGAGKRLGEKHMGRVWLALVYFFLYIPLIFLIVFSFNSTRQDGIFTGFSLRWYQALVEERAILANR